jgi:hypothetical protein
MKKRIMFIVFFIVLLIISNTVTFYMSTYCTETEAFSDEINPKVLIYMPPYESSQCIEWSEKEGGSPSGYAIKPYLAPMYGNSSIVMVNDSLVISKTMFNNLPSNYYCNMSLGFEWVVYDAGSVYLVYKDRVIRPFKSVIIPEYYNSSSDALYNGVTIKQYFKLSQDVNLSEVRIGGNEIGYLGGEDEQFEGRSYEEDFFQ